MRETDSSLDSANEIKFSDIRKDVPSVHVFGSKDASESTLTASKMDDMYDEKQYSEGYTEGDGSKANPYTYKSAAPVSPHYAIVDLWLKYRSQQCYIEVNKWLLQVTPEGVIAEDGKFTRLLPEKS